MKKFLCILLLLLVSLALLACGEEEPTDTSAPSVTTTVAEATTTASPSATTTAAGATTTAVTPATTTAAPATTTITPATTTVAPATTTAPVTTAPPTLGDKAKEVVDAFGQVPDVWDFLPSGLSLENYRLDPDVTLDYSSAFSVSSLPQNFIGKQMNVVYTVLNYTETALVPVRYFFGATNVIAEAYQQFINQNPDSFTRFEWTNADETFSCVIVLDGELYTASCTYRGMSFTIAADRESEAVICDISLGNGAKLKYEASDNYLKIGLALAIETAQLEFVKTGDTVVGYVFHSETYQGKGLITSAYLTFDESYTYVTGKKGDFANPFDGDNRVTEVYDSTTGRYVGSEVREDVTVSGVGTTYDTVWIPLYNISGITTIQKTDEANKKNPDSVFLNGSATPFKAPYNKVAFVETSRKADIEFKTVYLYVYDETDGTYKKEACEIPMLFVQRVDMEDYLELLNDGNSGITLACHQSTSDASAVANGYTAGIPAYDLVKEIITVASVKEFLGVPVVGEEEE